MKELYLLDNEFLKELDLNLSKTKYVRITSLTFEEEVLQTIEGIATSGSISVDGDSAVRRTCSLSLICEQIDINDFYWGLNTKFKLEIGLENNINPQYPKVVWFPQGIFLITSFSQSVQSNSHTISISGKDKMCLLNGEIGGTIPALSWNFGTEDIESANGVITNVSIPIKRIIRDAVMTFAKERPENIIINDLDDSGIELMEYRGAQPMYMYIGLYSRECSQITLNATQKVYIKENNAIREIDISEVPVFDPCVELNYEPMDVDPTPVSMDAEFKTLYTIAKIEYGQTAGYRTTDITYAGDLILSVGDNITSLLDKLKTMLGDFEYYYDLDGRFIFQRKKTYVNVSFNNIVDNREETYVENASETSAIQYSFVDNQLISSFQNTPNLSNLKNDYSIWGERKSVDGTTTPVHIRYAIDKKPTYYKNFAGTVYCTEEQFDTLIKEIDRVIRNQYKKDLAAYKPQYKLPGNLQAPIKNEDGSWTSGWWDLRDWYAYYQLIMHTEPNGTLKWYSQNDETGLVSVVDTIRQLEPIKDKISNWDNITHKWGGSEYSHSDKIWMLTLIKNNQDKFNASWGHCSPAPFRENKKSYSTFYTSELIGTRVQTVEHPETKRLINYPYNGCWDGHTFLTFMEECVWNADLEDTGGGAYIYNPNFNLVTDTETFEQLIEQQVQKEIQIFTESCIVCDWREIIYQMALDYRQFFYSNDDFYIELRDNNGYDINGNYRYIDGKTGYEQYYTDLEGFWRQLYCPVGLYTQVYLSEGEYKNAPRDKYFTRIWDEESKSYLYIDIKAAPVKEYDVKTKYFTHGTGYNTLITTNPELLNFWFDFLDNDSEMQKYSVYAIGDRSKNIKDDGVKSIYFRDTPTVIFFDPYKSTNLDRKTGYTYIQCPSYMEQLFSISGQGKSAIDELDNLLYNHAYCVESVSINAIPIYYLVPNTRIFIEDKTTGINGEYIVSKFSYSLSANATMSLTCTKAPERLY